jgi:hypothetical protein
LQEERERFGFDFTHEPQIAFLQLRATALVRAAQGAAQ